MKRIKLEDLQASIQDTSAFSSIQDYMDICKCYLDFIDKTSPTRIISPSHSNYMFFQYDEIYGNKITRPLNTDLYLESNKEFDDLSSGFVAFLSDLREKQQGISDMECYNNFIKTKGINKVIYTIQQSIGSIGDSFANPNQSRKRIGQLFENLIKLIIREVGFTCDSRTIKIPISNESDLEMKYELDLVFSQDTAILTSPTMYIHPSEIIGSVKTTSKDRIDKIFLDRFTLSKFLERNIKFIAIFLHDVQRAKRGNSIFGINSTFKTNHFLCYSVALERLDGVYYIDPLPAMMSNDKLSEEIFDFQEFIINDIWDL